MNNLKRFHYGLYKRVRTKGIVFTLLGLVLIFSTQLGHVAQTSVANQSLLAQWAGYPFMGILFVIIGAGLLLSLMFGKNNWRMSRQFLLAAFFYAVFWLTLIIVTTINGRPQSGSVLILWGYLCNNLWDVYHDAGWEGAALVRKALERKDAT